MEVLDLIRRLPQASQLSEEAQKRWLAHISKFQSDRAVWHAERLKGLGGSEIGAVLRHFLDLDETGFSDAQEVVESKLMLRMPLRDNPHLKRGRVLESLARLAFLLKYQSKVDLPALNALNSAPKRRGYEWLQGNPDDIVILPNGMRALPDYKVPGSFDTDIAYDYKAQLHHYDLIAKSAGVEIDQLILAKLDLAPEIAASLVHKIEQGKMLPHELRELAAVIAKADVPGMRVVGIVVPKDRDMQVDIIECGKHVWNDYVLKGRIPEIRTPKTEILPLPESEQLRFARYQQQYALAKAGEKQLKAIAVASEEAMKELVTQFDVTDYRLPLSWVKLSQENEYNPDLLVQEALSRGANESDIRSETSEYDQAALVEEIRKLNGDVNSAHLFKTPKVDVKKAEAFLTALEVPLDKFKVSNVKVALSRTNVDKEKIAALGEEFSSRFKVWLNDVQGIGSDPETPNEKNEFELKPDSAYTAEAFKISLDELTLIDDLNDIGSYVPEISDGEIVQEQNRRSVNVRGPSR